jgi:hypothetical protein
MHQNLLSFIKAKLENDTLKTCPIFVITLMPLMTTSVHFREFSGLYGTDFETFLLTFF